MGLITGASSLLTVAGGVASSVLGLGANALKFGGKFVKSTTGKIALGLGTVAVLMSDPKKGGFFGKAKELGGNLFKAVGSMIGSVFKGGATKAAATAMKAGESVNELSNAISDAESPAEVKEIIKEAGDSAVPAGMDGLCQQVDMQAGIG